MLDKIAFDQNQLIQRDVLKNNSDLVRAEVGINGNIQRSACELNSNNIMRQLEANMLAQNNFSALMTANQGRFQSLDNKIDNLERDLLNQKIADLRDDKILAGQTNNRLQAEVNAFCCPKPSARYEVVGCPTPCPGGNNGTSITDIITIINMMNGNRPGNS